LQPLSQAILLESFPPAKRGLAMATFGMGVVVAPIIGPVLGGWITDEYSWRWVFYINIPLGVLSLVLCQAFLEDPPYLRAAHERRGGHVDYIGFGAMALWLGTLQVILDRGQIDDWLNARWICVASVVSLASMIAFIAWELRLAHPLVDLRVLRNRNFALGTMMITVVGIVLYSTTALLPLFLQGLMGYPALNSGMAISPRGCGAIVALMLVGRLVGKVDTRLLITIGFSVLAYSCWMFGGINLEIATINVMWPNIISGLAMGFVFVPLTTATMGELPNEQLGNAAGIFNLMRNIGGGMGISLVTTLVARGAQSHQAQMVAHLTPYDPAFQRFIETTAHGLSQYGDPVAAGQQAYGVVGGLLGQQAALFAYVDTFRVLAVLCLLCIPLVLALHKVRPPKGPIAAH
jgi:DHA2 family multidrug resistance protein